ncbi:PWWP domain-containing protein [Entamoeba marina]
MYEVNEEHPPKEYDPSEVRFLVFLMTTKLLLPAKHPLEMLLISLGIVNVVNFSANPFMESPIVSNPSDKLQRSITPDQLSPKNERPSTPSSTPQQPTILTPNNVTPTKQNNNDLITPATSVLENNETKETETHSNDIKEEHQNNAMEEEISVHEQNVMEEVTTDNKQISTPINSPRTKQDLKKDETEKKPKRNSTSTTPNHSNKNSPIHSPVASESSYDNWSIVWAKQKGYPWNPAKFINLDTLDDKTKEPLMKFLSSKKPGSSLVRYLTNDYVFGWVDNSQIRPFKESFSETVTEKMLTEPTLVDSIHEAFKLTNTPSSSNDYKLQNIDLGLMVSHSEGVQLQSMKFKLEITKVTPTDNDVWKTLEKWKNEPVEKINQLLEEMLNQVIPIDVIINPANNVSDIITSLKTSTNIETVSFAELLFERIKQSLKLSIQSGEYSRCKEFYK